GQRRTAEGVMTGQGQLGRECAWCGLPAVCDVQVQPARYRTVSRIDPVTGRRVAQQRLVKAAIRVAACDEHRRVTSGQPPAVGVPRDRKATGVDQLGLFAPPRGGAIGGEANR
ncbi:MAG: hypothetical protein ACRDLN_14060, partial [Solirubrobacteraceae bacterium]